MPTPASEPVVPDSQSEGKEKAAICSTGVTRSGCSPEEITLCSGGHRPRANSLPAPAGKGPRACSASPLRCQGGPGTKQAKPRAKETRGSEPDFRKEGPLIAYVLPGTAREDPWTPFGWFRKNWHPRRLSQLPCSGAAFR